MDCSPPSSSVHEISQARIPAWTAISCSRRSFRPRDWTCVSYIPWIGRQILYHEWLLGSGKLFVTLLFMFRVLENNFFSSSLQTLIIGLTHELLEKAMAPHSSILAWKTPWAQEPGRLQSTGSLRVGHDWVTSLSLFTFMHWRRKWQPTAVFLPGESLGRQRLVGRRLWGRTESDTTEVT